MFVFEAGSLAAEGVDVMIDVVRDRRGRSPLNTAAVSFAQSRFLYFWVLTVHKYSLCHIICIMSCHHMLHAQSRRPAIQRLPSEHAAVCAVAFLAHLLHDLVHSPAIQLGISQYRQIHLILLRIPLHRLQTIVPVALDAFIDG
jgi:hypothetical protein